MQVHLATRQRAIARYLLSLGAIALCWTAAVGHAQIACAPLDGTAQYAPCVSDQLARQRTALTPNLDVDAPSLTDHPDYLGPDGTLIMPEPGLSLQQRGAAELDLAKRNSNVRTNLLQQQIQNDLRQQSLSRPSVIMPQTSFGTAPPWP